MSQRSHYMGRAWVVSTTTFFTPNGVNTAAVRNLTVPPDRLVIEPPLFIPLDFSLQIVTNTGIASAQAFGTARLDPEITGTGIASAQAFGTTSLVQEIATTGISSAESLGTATVGYVVSLTGIASAQAFGTAAVDQSDPAITALGIGSSTGFGTAQTLVDPAPPAVVVVAEPRAASQIISFFKHVAVGSTDLNIAQSLWRGTGSPGAGDLGGIGAGYGRVCTSDTVGAWPLSLPPEGRTLTINEVQLGASDATVPWTLTVVDRVADVSLSYDEPTGPVKGCDLTGVLPPGEGALLILEVVEAFGAGTNTFNFVYTNQNGVSGRKTGNITTRPSGAPGSILTTTLFVPLQAGDRGILSLDSFSILRRGTDRGIFTAALVRPVMTMGVPAYYNFLQGTLDFQAPSASQIRDTACLTGLICPRSTSLPSAGTYYSGALRAEASPG